MLLKNFWKNKISTPASLRLRAPVQGLRTPQGLERQGREVAGVVKLKLHLPQTKLNKNEHQKAHVLKRGLFL